MKLSMDEITEQMEQFKEGQILKFSIPEIFGGGVAVVGLNPNYPGKGEKKYLLKVGDNEKLAEEGKPYWSSDKAGAVAKWVADRQGDQIS